MEIAEKYLSSKHDRHKTNNPLAGIESIDGNVENAIWHFEALTWYGIIHWQYMLFPFIPVCGQCWWIVIFTWHFCLPYLSAPPSATAFIGEPEHL